MTTQTTRGIHHVGLTVPDLAAAEAFFDQALGFERVGEIAAYPAVFVSDGHTLITLWQAEDPATAVPFDRRRVIGLHHLALQASPDTTLDDLHERIARHPGAQVEFPPEPLLGGPTRHMMCFMPGGIRVELVSA